MRLPESRPIKEVLVTVRLNVRRAYYRRCRRLGWSNEDTLDWVESTAALGVALIYRSWEKGRALDDDFLAYCTNKAYAQARDFLEKEETQKGIRESLIAEAPSRPYCYDPIEDEMAFAERFSSLQELSEVQREMYLLHHWYGWTVRDISLWRKTPLKTVYSILRRARLKLNKVVTASETLRAPRDDRDGGDAASKVVPLIRPPPKAGFRGTVERTAFKETDDERDRLG